MFTFNGTSSASMNLKVHDIRRPIMPSVKRTTVDVAGMDGNFLLDTKVEERRIDIEVSWLGADLAASMANAHALAAWLYTESPAELTFVDEPGLVYYAQLSGDTDLDAIAKYRRGVISFACSDPHTYATSDDTTPLVKGTNAVTNDGGVPTWPVITAVLGADTTFVEVECVETKEMVRVGFPESVDDDPAVDGRELILDDPLESLSAGGWAYSTINEGGVARTDIDTSELGPMYFMEDGTKILIDEPGADTTGWHGPTVQRALPNAALLDDFIIEADVWMDTTGSPAQMGKAELYCLSQAGAVIGRVNLIDSYSGMEEIKMAGYGQTIGSIAGSSGWLGTANQRFALLTIRRINDIWSIACKRWNGSTYVDVLGYGASAADAGATQLGKIALNLSQYGTAAAPTLLAFSRVRVYNYNVAAATSDAPKKIGVANDVFTFDMRQGTVLLNGGTDSAFMDPNDSKRMLPISSFIDLRSTFFKLPTGGSNIMLKAGGAVTGEMTLTKRWL
jgi:predicted phage tail component-like protein